MRGAVQGGMEVVILPSHEAACLQGARIVARLLRDKPDAVPALATGSTPRPLYAEPVRLPREQGLSFARAGTFNLDEYVGIPPDHPASFRRYMQEALFDHVDLRPERIHVPDGNAADVPAIAAAY